MNTFNQDNNDFTQRFGTSIEAPLQYEMVEDDYGPDMGSDPYYNGTPDAEEYMSLLNAEMDKSIAANQIAADSREARQLRTVARCINAAYLCRIFKATKNPIGFQLVRVAKELVSGWAATTYANSGKPKPAYLPTLESVIATHAPSCLSHFLQAYKEIIEYPAVAKTNNGMDLIITGNGMIVTIMEGTSIAVTNAESIVIPKTIRVSMNASLLKTKTLDALIATNIHEYFDEHYRTKPIMFGHNLLAKLAMIVDAGISFDALMENPSYKMVCGYRDRVLEIIPVPSYNLFTTYGQMGAIPTTKAKIGLVGPRISIPKLIEYYNTDKGVCAVTRENPNKTMARLDKQDSKTTGYVVKSVPVTVVADGTHCAPHYASTGPIFVPTAFLLKYGHCRITSPMFHGGVKAALCPMTMLDDTLDMFESFVVFPSSLKGGLLAVYDLDVGDKSEFKNLVSLLGKDKAWLKQFEQDYVATWEERFINGKFCRVKDIIIDVRITNAYTAESIKPNYVLYKPESAIEDSISMLEKQVDRVDDVMTINGFRDQLMDDVINHDLKLASYISDNLMHYPIIESVEPMEKSLLLYPVPKKIGEVKWKSRVTRVIASELQSVEYWHGKDSAGNSHAVKWMKSLVNNGMNSNSVEKHMGIEYLSGTQEENVVSEVSILELAQLYVDEMTLSSLPLKHTYAVYPYAMLVKLVEMMCGFGHKDGWIKLTYGPHFVYVPANHLLYGDLNVNEEYHPSMCVASGLLPNLFNAITLLIDDNGHVYHNVAPMLITGLLKAAIQEKLLGKEFGRLYTVGGYKIILPYPHMNRDEIIVLSRDTYKKSNAKFVHVNLTKMPCLFHQATAGFKCRKDFPAGSGIVLSNELRTVLADVVFMHPETILQQQNDCDGDAARVSFDSYILPMYGSNGGIYGQFNGIAHKAHVLSETNDNQIKLKASVSNSMYDLHKAVWNSANAKDLVAKYTSNKFAFECGMAFTTEFTDFFGVPHNVSDKTKLTISLLLGELVQTEAMDNIKLDGSESHLSEAIMHFKLANPKLREGESFEAGCKRIQSRAAIQMMRYLKDKGYAIANLSLFCHNTTVYLQQVAIDLGMYADGMKVFSDRAMTNNLLSYTDSDLGKFFDAEGIIDSLYLLDHDSKSMYNHMLCEYVDMYHAV